MNRKQFLRNLEAKVQHLDYDVKQDILNEFDVHIRQGVHTGLSEEEVVASLGDFDEIVDGLLEQEEVKIQQEEVVKEDAEPKQRNRDRKPVIVEKKQPNKSNYLDFDPATIDKLYFEIENSTVVVESGDRFSMDYQSPNQDSELNYDISGSMLTFTQTSNKSKRSFISNINWGFKKDEKNKLVITWPRDLDFMEIKVESGAIRVNGLNIEDLHAESEMGSVTGQELQGDHFTLKSEMGRVSLEKSQAKTVTLTSEMGAVSIEDCNVKVYDVSSDMGGLTANNINSDADGKFKTDMGSVKAAFAEMPTNTNIDASSNMGKVVNQYGENHNAEYHLTFHSDMGSVVIK